MEQSYANYDYTPVYHQLQSTQVSPNSQPQQQQSQFIILPPHRTPDAEHDYHNQTVPSMSANFPSEVPIKIENLSSQPQEQHQPQVHYQNDQYLYSNQQNYQNSHPSYIPPLFNTHQFQPMPMWHGSENNFGYSQVVPQYPPMNYHPQSFDPRFMMGYQMGYMRSPKTPEQFSPQISPGNFQQPEHIQQQHQQFSCTDCNKSFMSATNLKRHLTTRVHFNKIKRDNPDAIILDKTAPNFEIRYLDMQRQQSGSSITDLSEAEVVLIDKIDKELSSIEPICWSTLKVEPMTTSPGPVAASPLPMVSSTNTASSPDMTEEFRCNICNKTFAKRCYFTQHKKTAHDGYKPFKCIKCGKKYQTQELLDNHMMKHGGEKPFKCETCSKSFNHKTDLKRHIILHTSEKPHVCQICKKGFVRKDHLQKHMASHMRKMEKLKRVYTAANKVKN